jgi:hypothetical protein
MVVRILFGVFVFLSYIRLGITIVRTIIREYPLARDNDSALQTQTETCMGA